MYRFNIKCFINFIITIVIISNVTAVMDDDVESSNDLMHIPVESIQMTNLEILEQKLPLGWKEFCKLNKFELV